MEGKKSLHVKAVHSLEQEGDWMHKALACTEALMPLIQSRVYRKFMRTVIFSLSFHWFIPGATGFSALCLPIGSSILCSGRCPVLLSSPSEWHRLLSGDGSGQACRRIASWLKGMQRGLCECKEEVCSLGWNKLCWLSRVYRSLH